MAKRKSGSRPGSSTKKGRSLASETSSPDSGRAVNKGSGQRKKSEPKADKKIPVATSDGRRKTKAVISKNEVPIVAVGASAGGLEAFTQLLRALPPDTGMAFVLITHLSHSHKSMLSELLDRATAMPVTQVGRRVTVRPDHVYVIRPDVHLDAGDGAITAATFSEKERPHMAIDHFMRSLAERRKADAIGVLLSGSGTDGTHGLAAIKAGGGVTIVQDEESARYPDMPRSAWEAGHADFRLPPDEIAIELARIAPHAHARRARTSPSAGEGDSPDRSLIQIFDLVRERTGVDFASYKPTTIGRRVSRRMLVHRLESLPDYVALLHEQPEELDTLFQDLLINVTGFFRDAEMFDLLRREFLPSLMAKRSSDDPIRAWIPGCATGEEVYSMAICLLEALGEVGAKTPIQVFGTDVSEAAIKRARAGAYPENIAADVSPERLRRFFVPTETGYQITPQVRDLCIFAPQNLVSDPPFSRIDLISCRNVLIYLGAALQKRAMATFHYALKPSGVLVLGTAETVGTLSEQFRIANKKYKIYTKMPTPAQPRFEFRGSGSERQRPAIAFKPTREINRSADLNKAVDETLLERYAPAGVVINPSLDIIHFRGQTSRFLEPAPGQASLNLLKMAREGLQVELRGAIHQAQRTALPVRKEGIRISSEGRDERVDIEVIPLSGGAELHGFQMVLFEAATREKAIKETPGAARRRGRKPIAAEQELELLRQRLASTQEDLHSIIEDQEASNEELQSANEEILSSNEELQSTNEELETAKEELQATNEEITTVNEELQNRNAELTTINNDLINLIASVDIIIIMLSQDIRIRRFTPSAQRVMNLIAADTGRPLRDINTRLQFSGLEDLIAEVINTMTVKQVEVQDADGRWYSMRVRPYRTVDNKIDGAVLSLVEIDQLKRLTQRLQLLSRVFQTGSDPIIVQDMSGKIVDLNDESVRIYGWSREELLGKPADTLIPPSDRARAAALLERCIRQEEIRNVKGVRWTKDGKRLPVSISVTLIAGEEGEPAALATIAKHSRGTEIA